MTTTPLKTFQCIVCGYVYEEAIGDPDHGLKAGTAWADVPADWTCPECGVSKVDFEMVEI
jgi:rubredoxin